ncbi:MULTISPECIES: LytR/AlgR family response regulator transcription factor [unclassified Saccharicrinis]|uniref:LytR/AlgR family response regulator transcription factor n=1 Tax=unclassified Saccharicrinis TaxID=2646859 RepID=UPI003D34C615
MKKIACIAIDDEPLALGLMVSHINKTPFLELKGEFDNPIDAMEFLQDNPVQLIYLDIQMPDFTGVEFARTLDESCKVIFTTAFEKYALEGFQLHALDYLLKPVSYEVFLKAAKHAQKHFDLIEAAKSPAESHLNSDGDYLFIKANAQLRRINYGEILYLEGLKDYVKLYTESEQTPIVFYATMKSVEERLPSERFMRVHRSFIVNLEKVTTIERYRIIFGKERIPISKQYKDAFDEFVKKKFL